MNLLRKFYDKRRESRISLPSSASTGSLRSIISLPHSASSVSLASTSSSTLKLPTECGGKSGGDTKNRRVYQHPRLAQSASALGIGDNSVPRSALATNVILRRQSCMELDSSTKDDINNKDVGRNSEMKKSKAKGRKEKPVKNLTIDTRHVYLSPYVASKGAEDQAVPVITVSEHLERGCEVVDHEDDGANNNDKHFVGYESSNSTDYDSSFGESDYDGEPVKAVRVSVSVVSATLVEFGGSKTDTEGDGKTSNKTVMTESLELEPGASMVVDKPNKVQKTSNTSKLEEAKQSRRRSLSLFGKTSKGFSTVMISEQASSSEPTLLLEPKLSKTQSRTQHKNNINNDTKGSSTSKRYGGLLRKWHSYTDFGALLGSSPSSSLSSSALPPKDKMAARKRFHNNGSNINCTKNINKGKHSAEEFPEKASDEDQQPNQIRKKQLRQQEVSSSETHALLRNGPLSHSLQPQKAIEPQLHKLRRETIEVVHSPFFEQSFDLQTPVSCRFDCDRSSDCRDVSDLSETSTAAALMEGLTTVENSKAEKKEPAVPLGDTAAPALKSAAVCFSAAVHHEAPKRRKHASSSGCPGEHKSGDKALHQQQRTSLTCLRTLKIPPPYFHYRLSHSQSTPNLSVFKMTSSPGSIAINNNQPHAMTTILMSPLKEELTPPLSASPVKPRPEPLHCPTMGIAMAITTSQTIVSTDHYHYPRNFQNRCQLPPIDVCDTPSGSFQPFYTPLSTPVHPSHTISAQSSPGYYSTSSPGTATELSKKKPRGAQKATKRMSQPSPTHLPGHLQHAIYSSVPTVTPSPLGTPTCLETPPLPYYSPSDIPLSTIHSFDDHSNKSDNKNDTNDFDWSFCSSESRTVAPSFGSTSAPASSSDSASTATKTIGKPRALPLPPINRPLPPIPTVTVTTASSTSTSTSTSSNSATNLSSESDSDNDEEVIITAVTVLGDEASFKRRTSLRPARIKNLLRRATTSEEDLISSCEESCAVSSPPESPTVSTSSFHRLFAPRARTRSTSSGAASVVSLPLFRTNHGTPPPQLPPLSSMAQQAQPMQPSLSGPSRIYHNSTTHRMAHSSSRLSLSAVKTSILSPLSPTFQLRFPRSATTQCMLSSSSSLEKSRQQQLQLPQSPTTVASTPMETQYSISSIFTYYAGHRDDMNDHSFEEEGEEDDDSFSETSSPQELHDLDNHLLVPHSHHNKLTTTPVTALFSPTTKRRSTSNPFPLRASPLEKTMTIITGRYGVIRHTTQEPPSACAFEDTDVWTQHYLARDETGERDYWEDYEDGSVACVLGNVVYI